MENYFADGPEHFIKLLKDKFGHDGDRWLDEIRYSHGDISGRHYCAWFNISDSDFDDYPGNGYMHLDGPHVKSYEDMIKEKTKELLGLSSPKELKANIEFVDQENNRHNLGEGLVISNPSYQQVIAGDWLRDNPAVKPIDLGEEIASSWFSGYEYVLIKRKADRPNSDGPKKKTNLENKFLEVI